MDQLQDEHRGAVILPRIAALLLFVFGLFPLANELTGDDALPWYRHALLFWLIVGGTIFIVTTAFALWRAAELEDLAMTIGKAMLSVDARVYTGALAALAFALAALIAVYCFGRQPHNADEVAQLFHAKILLSGRLALPADPNPEFFGMDNMIDQGRWYSQFPIGGPAILALGVAVNAAWLINPALIALTVLVVYRMTLAMQFGETVARISTLLFALSPFVLFMSASFMNHVPTLSLASIAMWQCAVWYESSDERIQLRSAALIGFTLGACATIRPLDALVVAFVTGVMQLSRFVRPDVADRGRLARSLGAQIVAGLLPVIALMYANHETTGSVFRLGYDVLYGSAHSLGFHTDPYGTEHTPLRALVFASKYLLQLNVLLFEWPIPVVGVIIAGLLAVRRTTRWDTYLLCTFLGLVVAYACYWHDGGFRGPRFLFTALPAVVILTAIAPFRLAARVGQRMRIVATYALPMAMLFSWLAYNIGDSVPGRLRFYRRASPLTRVDPDSLLRTKGVTRAVVFINEGRDARVLHYLWALGITRGEAVRLAMSSSACAVQVAINRETSMVPMQIVGRRERIIRNSMTTEPTQAELAVCVEDAHRDDAGEASYASFFPANTIDSTGHLGGNVVYALDLGAHNEVLRARFGDRPWFRYGPRSHPGDKLPELIPYQ